MQRSTQLLWAAAFSLASASGWAIPIANGIPVGTVGHYQVDVLSGGEAQTATLTADGQVSGLLTEDVLFQYQSFVDLGNAGGFRLNTGTPTLTGQDQVSSSGSFIGANGNTINWSVTSAIPDGGDTMTSVFNFSAQTGTLGDLRFHRYLDADVVGIFNDIFFTRGSIQDGDLTLFTVDASELIGLGQGGAFTQEQGLVNATFAGWAAGTFGSLLPLDNVTVTPEGNNLIQDFYVDPILGRVFGPTDVSTTLAWDLDPNATTATLVTTLQAVPSVAAIPVPTPPIAALLAIGLAGFRARRCSSV